MKACNTAEADAGGPRPAVEFPRCVGGEPGIFDMVGNVAEWVDACDGAPLVCALRGGSYEQTAPDAKCSHAVLSSPAVTAYGDVGFRCCSD